MHTLIFTGGLHPQKRDFSSYIGNLTPIDYVIAADSGFDTALSFGISCDLVIGDMDSVKNKAILQTYPKDKVIEFPKDKDYTDTELALLEAKKLGATHITLIGGDGGRLDHTLALLKCFEGTVFPNTWLCKEQVIVVLDEQIKAHQTFSLSKDATISVFSVYADGKIVSDGLQWELNTLKWDKGEYSVSNCINENSSIVSLTVKKGRFFVIFPYKH